MAPIQASQVCGRFHPPYETEVHHKKKVPAAQPIFFTTAAQQTLVLHLCRGRTYVSSQECE